MYIKPIFSTVAIFAVTATLSTEFQPTVDNSPIDSQYLVLQDPVAGSDQLQASLKCWPAWGKSTHLEYYKSLF